MTKNRLEAFSDGVFAIVITLLILDVRFPADKPLTLETLWGVAPHLWAFVLSFVIVGVYWVSHHNMLHFIRQVDRQLLESVRRVQAGLQSFLSMRRIDARRKNASAFLLRFSQSLASRRQRLSHAMERSTIQRLGRTTNPLTRSERLTISTSRCGRTFASAFANCGP